MNSEQVKYLNDNELRLWARHDIDKHLLAVCEQPDRFRAKEREILSEMLSNIIYERLDKYTETFDTVDTDNPEDEHNIERMEVNMYIFSGKELEEFLDKNGAMGEL